MTELNDKLGDHMENKWMVLRLDILMNQIEIYATFDEERDALLYLMSEAETDEQFADNTWYKKVIEDNCVSIYKLGYVFKKQLIYRYFIKHY